MSQNRHTSSRRILNRNKKRRSKSTQESSIQYQNLEDRKLLAADIGLNITTGTFGADEPGSPNVSGAVGPNHVIEVKNQGAEGIFRIFDKTTGNLLVEKNLTDFWEDTGGAGAAANVELVGNNPRNAEVLYDADTRRWFLASTGSGDSLSGILGTQAVTLVAVSRTSNPTEDWNSLEQVYDQDLDPTTGPNPRWDGGFLLSGAPTDVNLSVDDNNLYVTEVSGNNATTVAFNKFEDLVIPNPTSGVGLPNVPVWSGSGVTNPDFHVGIDMFGVATGSAFGVDAPASGDFINLTEISDPDLYGGTTFNAPVAIPVDPFEAPPQFIRQQFDPDLVNSGTEFHSHPVRIGNHLWAVHAIRGSGQGSNPDGGVENVSAIRWYKINLDRQEVAQSGIIEHPWQNYIYPSIAVTEAGHAAIAFMATGITEGQGLFPTAMVAIGYENNGVMDFETPFAVKDGENGFFDDQGQFVGHLHAKADPTNPDKLWVNTQWINASQGGQTQLTELTLVGMSPRVDANELDNEIIVRRSVLDNTQIEVVIDGIVVQSYQEDILYSITLDGMGGDDTFVIDTSNGEMDFAGGVIFEGDGNDQVEMRTTENTTWEVFVDGSGAAAVGNDFPATCDADGNVVHTQEFVLNFEAGSGWFDTTAYADPNGVYTNRGDALRGELQRYFDEVILPIFDVNAPFSIELDINDDEVDSLASASALGWGFDDVNGQQLYVASPWSILTGRGDRNSDASDGVIDYNLDLSLYQDNFEALLDNVRGGLTRFLTFKVLGMTSEVPNETNSFDPRGSQVRGTVLDVGYFDINDNPVIGNYDAAASMFDVLNYQTNASWAGDGSGLYFMGIDDNGNPMPLTINSNTELIDFDTLASALGGTSRDGDWNDIIEQDRAFLRGMGYSLAPVNPIDQQPGLPVQFSGMDLVQAGSGVDYFCIQSSNVDLEIRAGIGNDTFNVTGLGAGALDLYGEDGDDTYQVVFSPAGVVSIIDSDNAENDTLIGLGTSVNDNFVFDVNGIKVNAGLMVYTGLENISFDGLEGDDTFEVNARYPGADTLIGGDGNDSFVVNNATQLAVSVNDPATEPVDELLLEITNGFNDSYFASQIENLSVDGLFLINGANGTPTVAGGLNLVGGGDEQLVMSNTSVDATWNLDGSGTTDNSGSVTLDVADPMTFHGLNYIYAGHGVDIFNVTLANIDVELNGQLGNDEFNIANTGAGIVTAHGTAGDDIFNVTNSGGGVNLFGNSGMDTFTYDDAGMGSGTIDAGSSLDTITILRTPVVADPMDASLVVTGGDNIDQITINNPTGSAPITAFGGDGDDNFDVINSGMGDVSLQGQVGDDTYTVTFVDPTISFEILDSINMENDTLNATLGTPGDDVFNIGAGSTIFNGGASWTIVGIENLAYDGLAGNDTFNVDMGDDWDGSMTLSGGDDDDTFVVTNAGQGDLTLSGDAGDDTYIVNFTPTTDVTIVDSVGTENDNFRALGTNMVDDVEVTASLITINGGMVNFTGIEDLDVDALDADDIIVINSTISDTTVMGSAGMDVFNVNATIDGNQFLGGDDNDTFNINASSGDADFFGDAGQDTFNVIMTTGNGSYFGGDDDDRYFITDATGVSNFHGDAGADYFEISNTGANPGSAAGMMVVDGGDGINRMIVNGYENRPNTAVVTTDMITGMSVVPINFFAAGSFSLPSEAPGGIVLRGSDTQNDNLRIESLAADDSVMMYGFGGTDWFTVQSGALGKVSADGGEDSDLYRYQVGSTNNRFLWALDTGVAGSDRIIATLTSGDDDLVLAGESFRVDTDNFGFNQNFESMIVDTLEGNDTVAINRLSLNFLRVATNAGSDTVNVNNFSGVNSILVQLGDGDDNLNVNSGTVEGNLTAHAGNGNDVLTVSNNSYGNTFLDGQDGSDTYNIAVADRSERLVVARDTGSFGTDTLNVDATVLNDRLTMRSGFATVSSQDIIFNQDTEIANFNLKGSADIVNIFGVSAPETNVNTDDGHDLVFMHSSFGTAPSKRVNINAGLGNDVVNIRGTGGDTTTTVNGDQGIDQFNLGSSLADNDGNLNTLFGPVAVFGGEQEDFLYINDNGKAASFNFDITPTSIRNADTNTNFFGGITYDGSIERMRLDATQFRNDMEVTPSMDTAYTFIGNEGYNTIGLTGDEATDGREFFGEDGGNGFWRFSNGFKDVFFENFFLS